MTRRLTNHPTTAKLAEVICQRFVCGDIDRDEAHAQLVQDAGLLDGQASQLLDTVAPTRAHSASKRHSAWQPIETAPRDGTPVYAGFRKAHGYWWRNPAYPLTSRFLDGQWCAEFGGKWAPYEPQPNVWMRKS